MAENTKIEKLVLPRLDWHDSEGRINKDALIENFNAIEAKCNELNALDAFNINPVDFNELEIPYIQNIWSEKDDSKIVSLSTFIDALNLKNVVFNIISDGKTIRKLQYYNEDKVLVTLTNIKLDDLDKDNVKWVYLNPRAKTVISSAVADTVTSDTNQLIGMYNGSFIEHAGQKKYAHYDILELLAKMTMRSYEATITGGHHGFYVNDRCLGFIGKASARIQVKGNFLFVDQAY